MPAIDILRRPDGEVSFDPPDLKLVIGDRIFWRNLDEKTQHWVTLKGKPQDFWFRSALAHFVRGQAADVTSELVVQQEESFVYECFGEGVEGKITVRKRGRR
jgi:plastocyanin